MALTVDRRSLLTLAMAGTALPGARAAATDTAKAPAPLAQSAALGQAYGWYSLWARGLPAPAPPGLVEELIERAAPGAALRDRIARGVTKPGITLLPASRPDGSVVLIIPGGAYQHVVFDKEGLEIAEWMAARGTTAAVLRYRLPGDGWASGPDTPLQDAQRAMRVLRGMATELHFDAAHVGVIGCSAGGHLAARLLTEVAASYAAGDSIDQASFRPDFGALLYPVIAVSGDYAHAVSAQRLLGASPDAARIARYTPNRQVRPDTPPTWLVHAGDDTSVPLQNSLDFYSALRAHGVPAELHVYESGGHGFGLRFTVGKPVAAWPVALRAWSASHGFMSMAPA
jgi:acetyl esterase/lipase